MYKKCTLLFLAMFYVLGDNVTNENVERSIDLRSQLVKITSTVTLRNDGLDAIASFSIYLEPRNTSLSYVSVKDAEGNELEVTCTRSEDRDVCGVKTSQPLKRTQKDTFVFNAVYTGALRAHPKCIRQSDEQLILYLGNHYFYSPYRTERQTTMVVLNTKNIKNYTTLTPHAVINGAIKYGPFNNIEPLRCDSMMVHYESNAPFLSVTRLHRRIDVSHWGNIGVHEDVRIEHTGAKLTSPFSRFDYQHNSAGVNHHYVKSYVTVLPAAARDIYYRDRNGNISTSTVRKRDDYIELELRPRYPLFGGWKSTYALGYNLPSYAYLFEGGGGDRFVLRVPLLGHVFDDMHVVELEASIVLPFGARNVKVVAPYDVERLANATVHKYLDLLGHVVVNIRKTNLVEEHIQNVDVRYDWRPYVLLYEPMLLVGFILALFLAVVVCIRVDFSIGTCDHDKIL